MICGANNTFGTVTSSRCVHREQCIKRVVREGLAICCPARGCSEIYCSESCRQYSLWNNHALECAGITDGILDVVAGSIAQLLNPFFIFIQGSTAQPMNFAITHINLKNYFLL